MKNQGDSTPGMMSDLHRRIEARRAALDLSKEAVSVRAGLDKSYLKKLLARPNSVPAADTLVKLADALECTAEWLLGRPDAPEPAPGLAARPAGAAAEPPHSGASSTPSRLLPHSPVPPASGALPPLLQGNVRRANIELPPLREMPADVPVYGTVAGSLDKGAFQFEGGVIEFVRRPPAMAGSAGVYALYVEGVSMIPEHNPGDLRFVHTARPPRAGDSVVVQVQTHPEADIEGYIGHYLRMTPTKLVLGKLNPKTEVEIKREYVRAIHKVLTVNEMFGI